MRAAVAAAATLGVGIFPGSVSPATPCSGAGGLGTFGSGMTTVTPAGRRRHARDAGGGAAARAAVPELLAEAWRVLLHVRRELALGALEVAR